MHSIGDITDDGMMSCKVYFSYEYKVTKRPSIGTLQDRPIG